MVNLILALQTVTAAPTSSDPFAFFRPSVVVSVEERRQVDRGEPIARVLPSEGREVAVFAAVRVDIDGDRFVAWMRRITELKKSSYVLAIGRFSDPPRIEDLASLALDDDELSAIRLCRPGDCGLKLARVEIEELQNAIARSDSEWKPALQDAFRRLLLQRVKAYQAEGHAGLRDYRDQGEPVSLAERFSLLVRHSTFLSERLPRFAEHLEKYPRASMPNVESFIYWSNERIGRKPAVSATHVSILRGTDRTMPDALVATKEVFSTHYKTASLGLTAIVGGSTGSPGYLAYLNRSEADVLDGVFSGVVRWFIERRLKAEASAILRGLRQRLESGEPPPVAGGSACGPREDSESSSAAARASGGGAPRACEMVGGLGAGDWRLGADRLEAERLVSGGRRADMTTRKSDTRPMQDPEGQLERALIDEFLKARGYTVDELEKLPEEQAKRLLKDASVYAAGKLAEVEARAHFVQDLHRHGEE